MNRRELLKLAAGNIASAILPLEFGRDDEKPIGAHSNQGAKESDFSSGAPVMEYAPTEAGLTAAATAATAGDTIDIPFGCKTPILLYTPFT
jgi:hypothetical protein